MEPIAITGAAGFIGFRLARRLVSLGIELLLIDHPAIDNRKKNPAESLGQQFMNDSFFLKEFTKGGLEPKGIIHLAATIATQNKTWEAMQANNIEISKLLWRECSRRGIPFFYASTAATYGDGRLGFDDETDPSLLKPLNPYGQTKNSFDLWATNQMKNGEPFPSRWAGFKFFNVYGPGESHKGPLASMVWQCYRQIRDSGEVKLFASHTPGDPDGSQERDFVFVDDCIDLILWFSGHPRPSGIYNGGTGQPRSFMDLAHAVFAAMALTPKIKFIPLPDALQGKYQNRTCAKIEKLRKIGYSRSPTLLEEGVRLTIKEYREEETT